jgi:predicted transposase YbfD/YdcC
VEQYFSLFADEVDDPRVVGRCAHNLGDVLFIGFCAILCGAESFVEMERFGEAKADWLSRYLRLKNGIPSHDTFRRVISLIDPDKLEHVFFDWAAQLKAAAVAAGTVPRMDHVCFDGKSLKGTEKTYNTGRRPLHLVNVFSVGADLVLGQSRAGSAGCSEMAVIDAMLEVIDVRRTLVSVDAASSSARLLAKIRAGKGHYLCPIKRNQKALHARLRAVFAKVPKNGESDLVFDHAQAHEENRDRIETRRCTVVLTGDVGPRQEEAIRGFDPDICSLVRIERYRQTLDRRRFVRSKVDGGGEVYRENADYLTRHGRPGKSETVYYVSSLKLDASNAMRRIRDHWAIENKLHWSLDVSFHEDDCRVRDRQAARNLSQLRKVAFNVHGRHPAKLPLKAKIKKAGWDNQYLDDVVFQTAMNAIEV